MSSMLSQRIMRMSTSKIISARSATRMVKKAQNSVGDFPDTETDRTNKYFSRFAGWDVAMSGIGLF